MNILVIGCDQVGASLIRDLERISHDISLIEKDPEQLKRLDAFDDYIGILIYIRFSAISLPATKALRFNSTMASPLRWKMSRMLSCTF